MAPPKRKTGGRITPKGTQPGRPGAGASLGDRPSASAGVSASSRYTPPTPRSVKESPRWVPVLMMTLLVIGMLLIRSRYLIFDDTNVPMFAGLACILGGLYTATRWH